MNHRHRKTLHSLFTHPVSGNIELKDVEHVFLELGASLSHGHGGKLSVELTGKSASFHGHGHSLSKDEVSKIRKFIETCGIEPERDYPL